MMAGSNPQAGVPNSAVASPHWQASKVGRDVLAAGGNAVDAALATNAMLWACYPHMCGLGGDIWILYFDAATGRIHCLNGSGGAPGAATPAEFHRRGHREIPVKGPLSLAVPGAAAGWEAATSRFGTMPVADLLRPAAAAARDGVEVTLKMTAWMDKVADLLKADATLAKSFTSDGALLSAGSTFRQPDLADAISQLADAGLSDFYHGEIGAAIAQGVKEAGGLLTRNDLRAYAPLWVEPVRTRFDGLDVFTTPPNSQGIAALQILNLLSLLKGGRSTPGTVNQMEAFLEAKRLAYIDRNAYVADPAFVPVPVERLASLDHARWLADNAASLGEKRGVPMEGDTVYLCTADRWGNACSVIQSLYHPFGSCFVPAGTGIVMANRGSYFSLDESHPNVVAPGKRPVHTLMASMALKDGKPWLVFGTMGGEGQPQTSVQVLLNVLHGASPAEAVAAPRFLSGQIYPGDADNQLHIEEDFGVDVLHGIAGFGHTVKAVPRHDEMMGHAHAILIDGGIIDAGADPRSDGAAILVCADAPQWARFEKEQEL